MASWSGWGSPEPRNRSRLIRPHHVGRPRPRLVVAVSVVVAVVTVVDGLERALGAVGERRVDPFAQVLADLEERQLLGCHVHRFSRPRVTAFIGLVLADR